MGDSARGDELRENVGGEGSSIGGTAGAERVQGLKRKPVRQRLGASEAMKSRRVEYNGDQEPTIVDLEDYEGEETEEQFESMDYDVQEVDGDGGEDEN